MVSWDLECQMTSNGVLTNVVDTLDEQGGIENCAQKTLFSADILLGATKRPRDLQKGRPSRIQMPSRADAHHMMILHTSQRMESYQRQSQALILKRVYPRRSVSRDQTGKIVPTHEGEMRTAHLEMSYNTQTSLSRSAKGQETEGFWTN